MAAEQPNDPAKHYDPNDPVAVAFLCNRLLSEGMYFHDNIFDGIPVLKATFTTVTNELVTLISQCKGNSLKIKERDSKCKVANGYLDQNFLYAKVKCNHDISMIGLSGFDSKYQPTKIGVPETISILNVKDGKEEGTYKISVKRKSYKKMGGQAPKAPRRPVKFDVEITPSPEDPKSWVSILTGRASTKLIFDGTYVAPLRKNYVRVFSVNSAGRSQPSVPFPFTPRIL